MRVVRSGHVFLSLAVEFGMCSFVRCFCLGELEWGELETKFKPDWAKRRIGWLSNFGKGFCPVGAKFRLMPGIGGFCGVEHLGNVFRSLDLRRECCHSAPLQISTDLILGGAKTEKQ